MNGDGDLAVGLLAQGPAVLALDANGVRALFGEGHVVEEKNATRTGEGPGQITAVATQDGLLVPGALADELLERLFGIRAGQAVGEGDAVGEGLDAFAFAVEE